MTPAFTPQIKIPLVNQKTPSHCGPAVMQMLLSYLKVKTTQDEVVAAGKVQRRIRQYGMRPDMMATALKSLSPKHALWFKQNATMADIATLIEKYKTPVGINWQGLFYHTALEEKLSGSKSDRGHYSIIVGINKKHTQIAILDPYHDHQANPRIFSYRWFYRRWWDYVTEPDKKTGKSKRHDTKRLIFIITPKTAEFPKEMGLLPSRELYDLFA